MRRDFGTGSVLPFVVGIGVGAAAALFLAPKTGEDLRSEIGVRVTEKAGKIGASGREIKQRIEKVVAQAQDRVQDAIEAGQDAYQQAKDS